MAFCKVPESHICEAVETTEGMRKYAKRFSGICAAPLVQFSQLSFEKFKFLGIEML